VREGEVVEVKVDSEENEDDDDDDDGEYALEMRKKVTFSPSPPVRARDPHLCFRKNVACPGGFCFCMISMTVGHHDLSGF
jgi:hypothetical protein